MSQAPLFLLASKPFKDFAWWNEVLLWCKVKRAVIMVFPQQLTPTLEYHGNFVPMILEQSFGTGESMDRHLFKSIFVPRLVYLGALINNR